MIFIFFSGGTVRALTRNSPTRSLHPSTMSYSDMFKATTDLTGKKCFSRDTTVSLKSKSSEGMVSSPLPSPRAPHASAGLTLSSRHQRWCWSWGPAPLPPHRKIPVLLLSSPGERPGSAGRCSEALTRLRVRGLGPPRLSSASPAAPRARAGGEKASTGGETARPRPPPVLFFSAGGVGRDRLTERKETTARHERRAKSHAVRPILRNAERFWPLPAHFDPLYTRP